MAVNHETGKTWLMSLTMALFGLTLSFAGAGETGGNQSATGTESSLESPSEGDTEAEANLAEQAAAVTHVEPGKFWIGIICMPLEDELLKTHLGLEHGLLVTRVIEDSPADRAGLRKNDILIAVDDKPLVNLRVMAATIEKVQENELSLELIRAGKRQNVDVAPARRPARQAAEEGAADGELSREWKRLQKMLREHGVVPELDGDSFTFVMPGFILPDENKDFPKDLEVTITKKGEAKAAITVKRGDKQWDIDAESLGELPENIRPHVRQMLGRQPKMSIRVETDGTEWLDKLPKNLLSPRILKKSLELAPDSARRLRGFDRKLREKIGQQLMETGRTLDDADAGVPADVLQELKDELQTLREQVEQLRHDRAQQKDGKETDRDSKAKAVTPEASSNAARE